MASYFPYKYVFINDHNLYEMSAGNPIPPAKALPKSLFIKIHN
jgi:hypothetical protein